MRVCFISCIDRFDDTRISKLYSVLANEGFEIIAIMNPAINFLKPSRVRLIPLAPIKYFFWENSSLFHITCAILTRFRNMVRILWHVLRLHPDVIHCHEPDSWAIGCFVKIIQHSRVVVDFLETYESRANAFPKPLRPVIRRTILWFINFLSGYTDYVIHVSQTRQSLYPNLRCKTGVIFNYANLADFDLSAPIEIDSRLSDHFVVIHAGALRPSYGVVELLQSLMDAKQVVPNLLCLVLGGIAGSTETYNSALEHLIGDGVLLILPHLPYSQVIQYFRQSHVSLSLVLPVDDAHRYAFPRKLFESLAAGLPVIGSNAPDIRYVLEKWKCGIVVNTQNPSEISRAIVTIASDDVQRHEMARNARRAAEENFNWANEAKKIVDLYEQFSY